MNYEVLARKWRPQQFADVVGQEHVTQTLSNAITTERIAHAYLFVGPRGIGKTSVARIFAKALNCREGMTPTPCDTCPACLETMKGSNLDVLEIDGASNNGVDQVRDLRETVKYAPARCPFKIIIIDEVHMLSVAAFNALLKTLEEPPAHVKFMLATTEPDRIPATILSRCQRFDLRRIPVAAIIERLQLIAKSEKIKVEENALTAIARASDGGLRDAESALDQLISFCGKKVGEEDVLSVFGLVSRDALNGMTSDILKGDIPSLVRRVDELDRAGKDLRRLILDVMEHFRALLVSLHVDNPQEDLDVPESQVEVLEGQAPLTDTERLLRIIEILTQTEDRIRFALSRRTVVETALIRCARAAVVTSIEDILKTIGELRADGGENRSASEMDTRAAEPRQPKDRATGKARSAGQAQKKSPEPAVSRETLARDLKNLRDGWRDILEKVGRIAVLAKASLVDALPLRVEVDEVVLAFDPEFGESLERCRIPRNRQAIRHVLSRVLHREVVVKFETGPVEGMAGLVRPGVDGLPPGAGEKDSEAELPEAIGSGLVAAGPEQKRSLSEWLAEPEVQNVLEAFGGTIVDIRE